MSINKNFVVKNGFEVSTDLILANADTNKVGIGTTNPQYKLDVAGGIGATDFYLTGIGTFVNELNVGLGGTVLTVLGIGNSIGIGTALPQYLLDIRSPVSTGQTALYVQGDVRITGDLVVEDDLVLDEVTTRNITVSNQATTLNLSATGIGTITTLNSTSGTITNLTSTNLTGTSGTITTLNSTNGTITNLNVTGISTLGTVKVSSGIITATSGIVTYYGDGQYLDLTNNPSTGIGIGTTGGLVGYGITFLDLKGAGVSTTQYNSNTGIATIFFEGGGGGGGSISISTTAPVSPGSGDLWYSPDYGRTFIYYDESVVGYGTDAFWVDAAPFNVGIITALTNVSFSPGSALAPSMFFIGDQQTGFFSPGNGQFTVVSSGSSVLNVTASGIRVTGIATFTNASGTVTIGIGTTALLVEGNARVTGILTVGSSSITLNGSTNIINVGTGLTLSSSGINVTGVITATSFVGDGSGLTGAGSTVFIDTTTNQEFFPLFTATTSGTITASGISTSKLKYNPSTGTVTATAFIGSGANLTGVGIGSTGSVNTTGIITATSFFGSGANLTGLSGGGDFNTGIASATAYAVTTAMDTAYTAPATAGARHIVHSIHVTNIDGTVSADISGQLYAGAYSIANTIPVPPGSAVELLKQPKILSPSETIQLQSSATGDLHATITVETKAGDTTYIGVGTDITSAATYTDLHIATADTMLQSVLLANDDGAADVKANVVWTDGSNNIQGYFAFEMTIPADATVEILEKPKFLPNGFKVRVLANQANRLEAILSAKTI